ncbi:hypothetical protein HXX76_010124 [Chlamydomonas incerta]|uniref:ATP-dependent DNA helicase n=1 Tax=Chlamydomonas incerta TaxID=51695 RepID=A0A835SRQ7_CHLIN|nr:hypothetical protein HXX76_010124 [Chlamydomonas incerta]|eukprot:KAG2430606.1 hypothetical protein HXX76_010124 [Chlamydomonas incerta]
MKRTRSDEQGTAQAVKSAAALRLPDDVDDGDDVAPLSLSQDGIAITGEAAAPGAGRAEVVVLGQATTASRAVKRRAATPLDRAGAAPRAAPARPGGDRSTPVVVDLSLDEDDEDAAGVRTRKPAAALARTGAQPQPGGPAALRAPRGGNLNTLFAYPDDSPETQRRKLEALQQQQQQQAQAKLQQQQQQQQQQYPAGSQQQPPGPGLLGHLSAAAAAGAAGGSIGGGGGGGSGNGGGAFGSIRGILEPAGAAGRTAPPGGAPGGYGSYGQNPYQNPYQPPHQQQQQYQSQYGVGGSQGPGPGPGKQHTPPPVQTLYQQHSPHDQHNPYLPPAAGGPAGGDGGYGGGGGGYGGGAYGGGGAGHGAYGGAGVPTPQPYGGGGATASAARAVSHVSDTYAGAARPTATGATTHVSATVFGPSGSVAGSYAAAGGRAGGAAGAAGGYGGGGGGAARGIAVIDEGEVASPQLTPEQERVLALVRAGENIFFTGNAGTGKTFVLTRVIDELRERYADMFGSKVAVCASTGIAATHIGGTTLHSALGCGVPSEYPEFNIMMKKDTQTRIRGYEVLILDEASMTSGEFWTVLEVQLRAVRGSNAPAGGLQLIFSGDFFQLPPITRKPYGNDPIPLQQFTNWGYLFQSPAWARCRLQQVLLTQVFRQADRLFAALLDDIRYGRNARAALQRIAATCRRPLDCSDGIKPTRLYSVNKDVDSLNRDELEKLPQEQVTLEGLDDVDLDPAILQIQPPLEQQELAECESRLWGSDFWKSCLAAQSYGLKIEAQVMLVRNLDLKGEMGGPGRQLVNGSRGVVVGWAAKVDIINRLKGNVNALTAPNARGGAGGGGSRRGRRRRRLPARRPSRRRRRRRRR